MHIRCTARIPRSKQGSPTIHSVTACRNSHAATRVARSRPVSASCATCELTRSLEPRIMLLHSWRHAETPPLPSLTCACLLDLATASVSRQVTHVREQSAKPDGDVGIRVAHGDGQHLRWVPLRHAMLAAAAGCVRRQRQRIGMCSDAPKPCLDARLQQYERLRAFAAQLQMSSIQLLHSAM